MMMITDNRRFPFSNWACDTSTKTSNFYLPDYIYHYTKKIKSDIIFNAIFLSMYTIINSLSIGAHLFSFSLILTNPFFSNACWHVTIPLKSLLTYSQFFHLNSKERKATLCLKQSLVWKQNLRKKRLSFCPKNPSTKFVFL